MDMLDKLYVGKIKLRDSTCIDNLPKVDPDEMERVMLQILRENKPVILFDAIRRKVRIPNSGWLLL